MSAIRGIEKFSARIGVYLRHPKIERAARDLRQRTGGLVNGEGRDTRSGRTLPHVQELAAAIHG